MSSVEHPSGCINLRVDPYQEARIRAAAEVSGQTVAEFLLSAAAARAADVLESAGRIVSSSTAFQRFVAALDADGEPMPTLSRYAGEPGPIPPR